jgi:hypothetical protein
MRPLLLSPSDEMAICVENPGGGVAHASVPEEEEGDHGEVCTRDNTRHRQVGQARANTSIDSFSFAHLV